MDINIAIAIGFFIMAILYFITCLKSFSFIKNFHDGNGFKK